MKKLLGYFIKGLLFILPLVVVFAILRVAVSFLFPFGMRDVESVGLGLLIIANITLVGFVISKGASMYIKRRVENALTRVPLAGRLFQSMRKVLMIARFSHDIFDQPVIVRREDGRELRFGFVTKSGLPEFGLPDYASVYLPLPFSFLGEMVVIRHSDLEPLARDKTELVNLILSGGLAHRAGSVTEE